MFGLIQFPSMAEFIGALPIIFSLILIEGLLSVDNALAIAAMASHLPGKQKTQALRYGIIGAYLFRGICLFAAAWIISNPWLKIIGAAYLLYLMCSHFVDNADEDANPSAPIKKHGLFMTIIAIEIMDLSLSVDNVIAAVAFSPKLWIVCTGVFIGILALRFVAGLCIKLIEKFPILEHTAFLLIGYVGCILCLELFAHVEVTAMQKFVGIMTIVIASIVYSKTPSLQTICEPIERVVVLCMRPIALIVGAVVAIICWPFKQLYHIIVPNKAQA